MSGWEISKLGSVDNTHHMLQRTEWIIKTLKTLKI